MKLINFVIGVLWAFIAFAELTGRIVLDPVPVALACIVVACNFFGHALED